MTVALLDRAIEIVETEPFDMSSYQTCAVASLWRAAGCPGVVDQPDGVYADVLRCVLDANGFVPDGDGPQDLIDAMHEGVWATQARTGCTGQEVTLRVFTTARAQALVEAEHLVFA